jgi:hypothetical protein
MKCNLPGAPSLIDAHFSGRISSGEERNLRAHLPTCEACRGYYDRHLLLSALDPGAMSPPDRLATPLGLRRPSASRTAPLMLAVAAAAALFVAVGPLRGKPSDEFTARGSSGHGASSQLIAYRIERGQAPQTLRTSMRASDELAFAYANPRGYEKLMVFAVDEHRHIYWYHPEWSNSAEDPHALPIATGADVREIPAAISQPIDGSALTLFAIFSNDDLTVRGVERLIERVRSLDEPLPLRNAAVIQQRLSVER